MKKSSVSKAKRVQIFKWLLKKHCCAIEFGEWHKDKRGKKIITPVLFKGPSRYTLVLDMDAEEAKLVSGLRKCPEAVTIPWKYNFSYADILDRILRLMKKNDSACWLWKCWQWTRERVFIERGATIESLAIEFDMSWRDVLLEA